MNICPKCGNSRVRIDYPECVCSACRWSEPLIDYPISYREHQSYSEAFNKPITIMETKTITDNGVDKLQRCVDTLMGERVYRQNNAKKLRRIEI